MADTQLYDDDFFADVDQGSSRSAAIVVPILDAVLAPPQPHRLDDRHLVDVGCGTGAWTQAWQQQGWAVQGIDGDYAAPWLARRQIDFRAADLSKPVASEQKFDAALCLEVAEHLPFSAAQTIVASLCDLSHRVIFSAAQPGQGGTGHINEQPLSFWRDLFAARGYDCFDPVRPLIRHDARICPWYRYNLLVFIRKDSGDLPASFLATRLPADQAVPDFSSCLWRLRRLVLRYLPVAAVNRLAQWKNRLRKFLPAS